MLVLALVHGAGVIGEADLEPLKANDNWRGHILRRGNMSIHKVFN